MGSSLSKSHLPRNYWPEETGQVRTGLKLLSRFQPAQQVVQLPLRELVGKRTTLEVFPWVKTLIVQAVRVDEIEEGTRQAPLCFGQTQCRRQRRRTL
jgi:hypothetical protein